MITTIEKTITASQLDYVEELVRRATARTTTIPLLSTNNTL